MPANPVVVLSARRSPIGAFQGVFSDTGAIRLATGAIAAALDDARVDPAAIDEVLMGCVLPAGLGQAPARQAAIAAGIATSVPCTTVNKMCGSGMKTIMQGYDAILAGSAELVVAGGLESMTNAPYLLPKARGCGHPRGAARHLSGFGLRRQLRNPERRISRSRTLLLHHPQPARL